MSDDKKTSRPKEEETLLDMYAALPRPPVVPDERAIKAALKILNPEPAERERCLEIIKDAFELIEHGGVFFEPRSKKTKEAVAELLAALKRAKIAKEKLPWVSARLVEIACDFETAIGLCENEQKHSASLPKSGPPSHRQQLAVQTAHDLVQAWLVQRRDIYDAESLSHQSAWYKLSAILFGDQKINLLVHMSRYQKGHRLGSPPLPISNVIKVSRKPGSK
jgi:hypothetical protein